MGICLWRWCDERKRTGILFKILRFKKDDIEYFTTIEINKDKKVFINVMNLESHKIVSPNGKEYISPYLKNSILFHSYGGGRKKVCIKKHFRSLSNLMSMIRSYLELHYNEPIDNKMISKRKSDKEITDLVNSKIEKFDLFFSSLFY
jgi:hypothetical protein